MSEPTPKGEQVARPAPTLGRLFWKPVAVLVTFMLLLALLATAAAGRLARQLHFLSDWFSSGVDLPPSVVGVS
jgi:hypothetical protein